MKLQATRTCLLLMHGRLLLAGLLAASLLACSGGNGGDDGGGALIGFDLADSGGSSSSSSSGSSTSSSSSSSSSSSGSINSSSSSSSSSSSGSINSSSSSSSSSSSGSINSSSSSSSSSSSGGGRLHIVIPLGSSAQGVLSPPASDAANFEKILQDMVTSAAACSAGRLLLADMQNPPLYTSVQGICVPINPAAPEQAQYYSDAACTRRLAFRPTTYSSYCKEMLAIGPNERLGNAASWTPDPKQPNDPVPATPSRKWTVPWGTRLAFSSEPVDGKTAPFMKRLRYREVVTSYNVRPLYWSCNRIYGPCAPTTRPQHYSTLLGYIKKTAEPGTMPLYWYCVSTTLSRICTRGLLSTQAAPGSSLLGYIPGKPLPDTHPLYQGCANRLRPSVCIKSSEEKGTPLGYIYDQKIVKGTCALEMRVYKKDARATGLTPLLAFHGGAWRYRGGAFLGFEAQLANYTEDGFIVFVPFYRLTGEADGNSDCNGAPWNAVTADAEAALDWVKRNAVAFGAKPVPPAVMGQSAGAHLAGWLLVHRQRQVSAGLLLYGPSDVYDFLEQTVPEDGLYHAAFGSSLKILSRFYGSDVRSLDLDAGNDFVRLNSYHDYVRAGGVPPVFLIHGSADAVVPSNQSVLMCNAYGGNAENRGGGELRRATYVCGRDGRLDLFEQGEHGLDGCLRKGSFDACAAGDDLSRQLLTDSLREARAWLREQAAAAGK